MTLILKSYPKLGDEIIIKYGKLVKGAIESKAMEGELLENMFVNHGAEFTRNFLDSATVLSLEAISIHGLSVSLKDYTVSPKGVEKSTKSLTR